MWLIAIWGFIMIGLLAIGGFFMFRKFLKALPREDGWSELDWQECYIEQALPLWNGEARKLLDELVSPVPQIFRDVAKQNNERLYYRDTKARSWIYEEEIKRVKYRLFTI